MRYLFVALTVALMGVGLWYLGKAGLLAAKAWAAPIMIADAFDKSVEEGRNVRPWPWADTYPVRKMISDKSSSTLYVLHDSNMRNLAFGPTIRNVGQHQVLFGHNDTHFRFLEKLVKHDEVQLFDTKESKETWKVLHTEVVDENNLYLPDESRKSFMLFVTCYPFDLITESTDKRYVVWLEKVEDGPMTVAKAG